MNIKIKRNNTFGITIRNCDLKVSLDWVVKQFRFPWTKLGPHTAFVTAKFDYYLEAEIGVELVTGAPDHLKWVVTKAKPENVEIKLYNKASW